MNRHGTMYDIGKFIRLITNMYTFGMTFLLPPAGSNNLRRLFISPSTHLEGHVSSQKSMYTILDVLSMLYVVPCCAYIVLRFVPGWTNCVQSVVTTSSGVVIGLPMELNTVFLFTYIYIRIYDDAMILWDDDENPMGIHYGITFWEYVQSMVENIKYSHHEQTKKPRMPFITLPQRSVARLGGPNISILCHSTHDHLFELNRGTEEGFIKWPPSYIKP